MRFFKAMNSKPEEPRRCVFVRTKHNTNNTQYVLKRHRSPVTTHDIIHIVVLSHHDITMSVLRNAIASINNFSCKKAQDTYLKLEPSKTIDSPFLPADGTLV